jgi:hypothetical protein
LAALRENFVGLNAGPPHSRLKMLVNLQLP